MRLSKGLLRAAVLLTLTSLVSVAAPGDTAYRSTVEKWRQGYEASLKADYGWLSVSGLFWLHDGQNTFGSDPLNDIVLPAGSAPPDAGTFEFHEGELHKGRTVVHIKPGIVATMNGKRVETADLRPDTPDQIAIGDLRLLVHASGDRYAIRLKDKNSALRKNFAGLHWYPVDESFRVTARFVPYDKPKNVEVQNMMGDSGTMAVPGYVVFTLHGQEVRLEPEADGNDFSFVFRDMTSGKETYGAARFLDTTLSANGQVILDFNEAYNPPCAYNPYTTCPLPLPQNRLRVRIEAGEMKYGGTVAH
jgi:uncharacterized protein (DUF1684 family)